MPESDAHPTEITKKSARRIHLAQRDDLELMGTVLALDWWRGKSWQQRARWVHRGFLKLAAMSSTDFLVRQSFSPLPIRVKDILPAQYSLLHHSMRRRRVSLPSMPPSASDSLAEELTEGAGEATREGIGEGAKLPFADVKPFVSFSPLTAGFAFSARAASVSVALLPVPNLIHGCPGFVRCLLSWNILHMSCWRFFLFSESTALSSRRVHEGEKSGEWKKLANLDTAPGKALTPTLK